MEVHYYHSCTKDELQRKKVYKLKRDAIGEQKDILILNFMFFLHKMQQVNTRV
jgi:hypothetical protein